MFQIDREIGNLETRMKAIEVELQAIRRDGRETRDALMKAKGGWMMLTLMVACAASAIALLAKLSPIINFN